VADGTATTEGAESKQVEIKKRDVRDVGVQTEDPPPTAKEQAS
jgi:hypothetical protein